MLSDVRPITAWSTWARAAALVAALLLTLAAAAVLVRAHMQLRSDRSSWAPSEVDGRDVLVSEDLGPGVVGWIRSVIVMPRWALRMPRQEREKIIELQLGYSEVARSVELDEAGRREQHPRRLMMDAKVLAELSTTEWEAFAALNAWRIGWFLRRQRTRNNLTVGEGRPSCADPDST